MPRRGYGLHDAHHAHDRRRRPSGCRRRAAASVRSRAPQRSQNSRTLPALKPVLSCGGGSDSRCGGRARARLPAAKARLLGGGDVGVVGVAEHEIGEAPPCPVASRLSLTDARAGRRRGPGPRCAASSATAVRDRQRARRRRRPRRRAPSAFHGVLRAVQQPEADAAAFQKPSTLQGAAMAKQTKHRDVDDRPAAGRPARWPATSSSAEIGDDVERSDDQPPARAGAGALTAGPRASCRGSGEVDVREALCRD